MFRVIHGFLMTSVLWVLSCSSPDSSTGSVPTTTSTVMPDPPNKKCDYAYDPKCYCQLICSSGDKLTLVFDEHKSICYLNNKWTTPVVGFDNPDRCVFGWDGKPAAQVIDHYCKLTCP